MSQTTAEPDKLKCSNIQDECKPFIVHVEPESLTMLDELDSTTIWNEQNELYKSRGLKREVRLNHWLGFSPPPPSGYNFGVQKREQK